MAGSRIREISLELDVAEWTPNIGLFIVKSPQEQRAPTM
jgi:hypothetical protein